MKPEHRSALIDFLTGVQPVKDQIAKYINTDQLRTIAGIALAHGLPLFTRNRVHLKCVENLKLL